MGYVASFHRQLIFNFQLCLGEWISGNIMLSAHPPPTHPWS